MTVREPTQVAEAMRAFAGRWRRVLMHAADAPAPAPDVVGQGECVPISFTVRKVEESETERRLREWLEALYHDPRVGDVAGPHEPNTDGGRRITLDDWQFAVLAASFRASGGTMWETVVDKLGEPGEPVVMRSTWRLPRKLAAARPACVEAFRRTRARARRLRDALDEASAQC